MHNGPSTGVFFDSKENLYSCGYDATVNRWNQDYQTAKWQARHNGLVNDVVCRGNIVATVGADRRVRFWDAEDGRPIFHPTDECTDDLNAIRFLSDDDHLVTASDDGKIYAFNFRVNELVWERSSSLPDLYGESVEALETFQYDGADFIFFGNESGDIGLLDAAGNLVCSSRMEATVECCAFDKVTRRMLCGTSSGKIVAVGLPELNVEHTIPAHVSTVKSIAVAPDGRVATSSYSDELKIWTPKLLEKSACQLSSGSFRGWARSLSFHPTKSHILAVSSVGDKPLVMDVERAPVALNSPLPTFGINCVTARHNRIVLGVDDGFLWYADRFRARRVSSLGSIVLCCGAHSYKFVVAAGTQDGNVFIVDLSTGAILKTIKSEGSPAVSLAYSPSSALLSVGYYSGDLVEYDSETYSERGRISFGDAVKAVAYLGEEVRTGIATADGALSVCDMSNYRVINSFGNTFLPNAVGWSKALGRMISVGRDLMIRQWEKNLRLHASVTSHTRSIKALAVSPEGRYWATSGYDSLIHVWDKDGRVCTARGHDWPGVPALVWLDSEMFVSGGWDSTLRFWNKAGKEMHRVNVAYDGTNKDEQQR